MHSLCAACSWRLSLCSGAAPWYYICFPKETHINSWVIEPFRASDIFIQRRGFSLKGWSLCNYFVVHLETAVCIPLKRWLLLARPLLLDTAPNARRVGVGGVDG